jgi:hypothetical protein
MNYLLSYWISPDSSDERKDALRTYFDLQCYLKQQFGAKQTIVTNLDYAGAIPLQEPPGFSYKYGMFAKHFGLGQMIRNGLEFPIAVHDHDMFIRQPLAANQHAIRCSSGGGDYFSDQLVIYPELSKHAVVRYIDKLESFDFPTGLHSGYGTEVRHEKMYSTEVTQHYMEPRPFTGIDIDVSIPFRDLVTFDILEQHSLDAGVSECKPIPMEVEAVHGHLNKGPATDALIGWLSQ